LLQLLWEIRELDRRYHLSNSSSKTIYNYELDEYHLSNSLRNVGRILGSEALFKTMWYLLDHGVATSLILQYQAKLSDYMAEWAVRQLKVMGLIQPAIKTSKTSLSKRGPKEIVWMIEGALPGQIRDAILLHQRLQSPKYRLAVELAQTLLDEYTAKGKREIAYREIVLRVKELHVPFSTPDIAELTAQYLHERGVRIWR
jgi:hypothetical protein